MDVGLYIRDYIDDPTRPLYGQMEEAAEIFRQAKGMGSTTLYMPQHFIAYPSVWPQPMAVLSRFAPDAEGLRLMTGILLLTPDTSGCAPRTRCIGTRASRPGSSRAIRMCWTL